MNEGYPAKSKRRLRMAASSAALWSFDKLSYRLGVRQAADLTLPDFLVIGAQKAGTNWVWENLRCHPELYLPDEKELHYFNLYFYRSLRSYASRFLVGSGRLKGEVTPAYSILPRAKIKFIRQITPAVKLILVLRNPVDRAWSRAKMMLKEPGAPNIDLSNVPEGVVFRLLAHRSSIARGNYIKIVDNWLQHFPSEQLHVCFYDDISERPRDFLQAMFKFLGVRSDVDWGSFPYKEVITPGAKTPMPEQYKLLLGDLYRSKIEDLYQRFGSQVQRWRIP